MKGAANVVGRIMERYANDGMEAEDCELEDGGLKAEDGLEAEDCELVDEGVQNEAVCGVEEQGEKARLRDKLEGGYLKAEDCELKGVSAYFNVVLHMECMAYAEGEGKSKKTMQLVEPQL